MVGLFPFVGIGFVHQVVVLDHLQYNLVKMIFPFICYQQHMPRPARHTNFMLCTSCRLTARRRTGRKPRQAESGVEVNHRQPGIKQGQMYIVCGFEIALAYNIRILFNIMERIALGKSQARDN